MFDCGADDSPLRILITWEREPRPMKVQSVWIIDGGVNANAREFPFE
jgi:hypothetical protein